MTAQINLFHARFRIKHLLLPFSRMVIISLLATLIIPGMVIFNNIELKKTTTQLTTLKDDYNRLESEWKKINSLLSQRISTPEFSAQALKLESILAHRTEILKFMAGNSFDNSRGYSDYLIALARQHISNIWLTRISIMNNGTDLSIEGKVNNSAILPDYLQRLSNEPILAGTNFKTLRITRDSDDLSKRSPLSFMIASTPG